MNALAATGGEVPAYYRERLESGFVCFELSELRVDKRRELRRQFEDGTGSDPAIACDSV